ncbi:hypothetical protein [Streptomyces parvus]|uniref:hypothetical protein n=1 Tax=Streptomyces parvus TaxID=66428 RepID=UPI0021015E7B|nr:hypothetical protein [Streptomyces parvus]MCQ1579326.1 hypothetical protein [Streptomyces parvus]
MTASGRAVETVTRQRKRRTRSRTISPLGPIVVSKLSPAEYDLDPASISLVCPTCRTWVPIHVAETERATAKLVPHHTEPAGTEDPVRCLLGSHRLVTIDVNVAKWSRRLEQGVAETSGRRADRVVRKPQPTPTPAVMQIVGGLVDDKTARRMNELHVNNCTVCSSNTPRCADGRRLAHLAAHTQRTEPLRRKRQTEQEEWDDKRAWALRLLHEQQWNTVSRAVHATDQQRVHDVLTALRMMLLASPKPNIQPLTAWERADLETTIAVVERQMEDLTHRW